VKVDRRDGVRLQEHETWAETTPWAKYLATLTASERDKQHSQAMRIVGDARYVTLLYGRYCTSRWRFQMTFEKWLKRRQSQKEKHTPRSRNKGGTK
jgi:hypothetical protein